MVAPFAGIEIEDDGGRPIQIRRAREQHMLLDVAEIGRPEQRRAVIAQDVVDVRPAFAPRHREALHPPRRVLGAFFS